MTTPTPPTILRGTYQLLDRLGAGMFDLAGMFWLVRRGGYGVAHEWDDPRAG